MRPNRVLARLARGFSYVGRQGRVLLVVAASACLAACVPVGYVEAPAVAQFVRPKLKDISAIDMVSVCRDQGDWYATILFEDGLLTDYRLTDGGNPKVELNAASTSAQRDALLADNDWVSLECVGSLYGHRRTEKIVGTYRLVKTWKGTVEAHVFEHKALNARFDDADRRILSLGLQAIDAANAFHQEFVAPQVTWGLKL